MIETIRAGRSAEELDPYIERLQNLRVVSISGDVLKVSYSN